MDQREPEVSNTDGKVRIMDLEIDVLDKEALRGKIKKYLSEDGLNVIHFVSSQMLEKYANRPERKEGLEWEDLLLPGEKAVLSQHHGDLLETAGMNVDYRSFISVMLESRKDAKSIFVLAKDEKEMLFLNDLYTRITPIGRVVGQEYVDGDFMPEAVVNEINTQTPDILALSLADESQEQWLSENKSKVNAKLCIVLGDVADQLKREYRGAPAFVRRMGMEAFYYAFRGGLTGINARKKRIFHKKMVNDYNNAKAK